MPQKVSEKPTQKANKYHQNVLSFESNLLSGISLCVCWEYKNKSSRPKWDNPYPQISVLVTTKWPVVKKS